MTIEVKINGEVKAGISITRKHPLETAVLGPDSTCRYEVDLGRGHRPLEVVHRYGDGFMPLAARALNLARLEWETTG